jgi:3D (Asp-Asp-Asp) domain-containing protein
MNSSKIWRKFCTSRAALWFAVICVAAVFSGCQDRPPQAKVALPLGTLVTVPAEQNPCVAAAASPKNSQVAAAAEREPLPAVVRESAPQWRTVRMRVTAYCPCPLCCGPLAQGRTANGRVIRPGDRFVAAPKKYSFGTEIIVPHYNGNKAIKVLDRGSAITGNHLDLFFPSHTKAAKWGVKYLNVKVRTNQQQET